MTDSVDVDDATIGIAPEPPVRNTGPLLVVSIVSLALVALIGGVVIVQARRHADAAEALAARQAQVEHNGVQVMPFDQNLTTHSFTKTESGGVETVAANDPGDGTQATLIQQHLQHERELFSNGDFSDPMAIHGHQMPGIGDLQKAAAAGQVTVTYETLPGGARLTYTAATPALVDTVHAWFDAQLIDHGSHASG